MSMNPTGRQDNEMNGSRTSSARGMRSVRALLLLCMLVALPSCVVARFKFDGVGPEQQPADDPLHQQNSWIYRPMFEQLEPVCQLKDAQGNTVSTNCGSLENYSTKLSGGTYHYVVKTRCQPNSNQTIKVDRQQSEEGDENRVSSTIPLPKPETRYLSESTKPVWIFPDALGSLDLSRRVASPPAYQMTMLPPNSKVQILRRWPGPDEQCTKAIIRVVDAGGKARQGALFVVDLDQLSAKLTGPSAAETAAAQEESRALVQETRRQEEAALSAQESKDGRCDANRSAQLQAALQVAKSLFQGMSDANEVFRLDVHKILAAKPNSASVSWQAVAGGEIHVFAIGYNKLKLDVEDAEGNSAAIGSPYEMLMSNLGGNISSRVIQVNSGETFTVRVQGLGCALVAAFRRF